MTTMSGIDIRTVEVVQYVQPLREGGSLPAIVRADDDFPYVLKFRGAGQGPKALVAELLGGELARAAGLKVPELVFMQLDDSFSKNERDEEIQDLLRFSVGLNLGLHYLSGAITYDPLVLQIDPLMASKIVLVDSIINNIDRTAKNTNLLVWKKELWLIDHGASLYFHHNWPQWHSHLPRTFPAVKDHVLLGQATQLPQAAEEIKEKFSEVILADIISNIPDIWLLDNYQEMDPMARKKAYLTFLLTKVRDLDLLAKEAADAQ